MTTEKPDWRQLALAGDMQPTGYCFDCGKHETIPPENAFLCRDCNLAALQELVDYLNTWPKVASLALKKEIREVK